MPFFHTVYKKSEIIKLTLLMFVPVFTWSGIINSVNSVTALINLANIFPVDKDV